MELSTDVKTHVIMTFTKSVYFINEAEHRKLINTGLDEMFMMAESTIKASNIAEIMTVRQYYEMYPDKRPVKAESFKIPKEEYEPFDLNKHLIKNRRRITYSIRGIEKHIADMEKDGGKASGFSYNHRDKLNRLLKEFDRNNKIKREPVEVPQSMNYIHN